MWNVKLNINNNDYNAIIIKRIYKLILIISNELLCKK
jgi:hypothetical protein